MQAVGILQFRVDQPILDDEYIMCVQMNYAQVSRSNILYCGLQKKVAFSVDAKPGITTGTVDMYIYKNMFFLGKNYKQS